MDGLPDAVGMTTPVFAAHPEQSGRFYAASNQGLFCSHDSGRSWERIPLTWDAPVRARNVRALAVVASQ
jgi:hypothetical protein